jgi:SAM-dependent methyltransferase
MTKAKKITDIVSCPLCHGEKLAHLFLVRTIFSEFQILQCRKCGLTRTFPLPTDYDLDVHDTSLYYGKSSSKFIPFLQKIRDKLMNIRAKYYIHLIPDPNKRPMILDVGCAEGRLLKAFLDCGCECFGIEHPTYPEERFLYKDRITYLRNELDCIDLDKGSFDLIFLWHVLEHMDDPSFVIKKLSELLNPDGMLILAVPNFACPEANSFKGSWFHLDVPWHKYHFNINSLRYLSEDNNLRIIKSGSFCVEQSVYGLVQSILNKLGWPKNEFYELLKGNPSKRITLRLLAQIYICASLLIPSLFVSFFMASIGRGSVIKMVLKKEHNS